MQNPKKGLTSLLKPYYKIETLPLPAAACCCLLPAAACCCLLLPAPACSCLLLAAAGCCLLLPAAACCCLLLPAAACCWQKLLAACCCLLLVLLLVAAPAAAVVLLWCCCNQTASKARNKQPDTLFETHPKEQKRSNGTPKKGLTSLLKPYYKIETLPLLLLPAAACSCLLLPAAGWENTMAVKDGETPKLHPINA